MNSLLLRNRKHPPRHSPQPLQIRQMIRIWMPHTMRTNPLHQITITTPIQRRIPQRVIRRIMHTTNLPRALRRPVRLQHPSLPHIRDQIPRTILKPKQITHLAPPPRRNAPSRVIRTATGHHDDPPPSATHRTRDPTHRRTSTGTDQPAPTPHGTPRGSTCTSASAPESHPSPRPAPARPAHPSTPPPAHGPCSAAPTP